MSGDSAGVHIHAVFVTKETANVLLQYVKDMDTVCYILPAFENTAWSMMAVSFLSLLAVSTVLLTFFFVRRYRIRHFSSRFLLNREAHGLSSREVKALPAVTFKTRDISGTDTFAICLESYEVGQKLRILPCHHGKPDFPYHLFLACMNEKHMSENCIKIFRDNKRSISRNVSISVEKQVKGMRLRHFLYAGLECATIFFDKKL